MSRTVLVIGAGIIGLSAAEALVRRGCEVTVLDSDLRAKGCSYGNGGLIVPSHFTPLASPGMLRKALRMLLDPSSPFGFSRLPNFEMLSFSARFLMAATKRHVGRASPLLLELHLASRKLYEELIARMGVEVGYHQDGCLMLCRTEEGFCEEVSVAEQARSLGMNVRILRGAEVDQCEPEMKSLAYGAIYFQDDAHLDPGSTMDAFTAHLTKIGVRSVEGTVTDFHASDGTISKVVTTEGEIRADEVVVAAGAWSGKLARKLGLRLPLLSGRGYGFTLPDERLPSKPFRPAILVEARIAVTPIPSGVRFVGVLELGPPIDSIRASRLNEMKARISDCYPSYAPLFDPKGPDVEVWLGHRPCTPDGLPYVGRSRSFGNLTIATGHAMMGMSLGPISGELVAQIVCQETTMIRTDLLSPDRFN